MSHWLTSVRRALDESPRPVYFYFRNDDAGWNDERLMRLLDLFSDYKVPIDLAVIPSELTPGLMKELNRRVAADSKRVRVHQHGFAHLNHEASGRKCEFGASRDIASQRADIERGRARLLAAFGDALDPIFTPPWNRCTRSTAECLRDVGIQVLSRESRAVPFHLPGLREAPIHLDWFAHRKGVRLSRDEFGQLLATAVSTQPAVGLMLHHAIMDQGELAAAQEVLRLLSAHPSARFCTILQDDCASRISAADPLL